MPVLAIKGGKPEAEELKRLVPEWPIYSKEDICAIREVLESRRWCRLHEPSKATLFEQKFARFHDAKYGIAVANGTVAIELALKALDIKIGDIVLVPAITFIASASAITEVGAIPIFVDIDPETGCISPTSLRETLEEYPEAKAMIVVHYSGYPVDMDKILAVANEYNIRVIEDCAHAHGTEWKGRKVGAIGDMGTFSFQESKTLTSGEGGIVLTNDDKLAEKARLIHNIGRVLGKPGYMHYILSSNYRMTEFQAALLLSQMERLPQQIEIRHRVGKYLASKLRKIGGVEPLKDDERITNRGYYFFVFKYDSKEFDGLPKEKFLEALNAEGVPAGSGYGMPLYRQPAFARKNLEQIFPLNLVEKMPRYEEMYLENAELFSRMEVTLPQTLLLGGEKAADLVVSSIKKIKEHVNELFD